MDRVGEAILTAPDNGKLPEQKGEAKRSVNGVRVVGPAGRKDRHSKVFTARGTRDRRVRLSPKTAILFYDVQERLGCDRPSKAIDWLMKEAKAAIDALNYRPPAAAAADSNQSAATNPAEFKCDDIINPISGPDFFSGGAAPPSEELQGGSEAGEDCLEQFLMSSPTPLELFDVNSDIVRLQKLLSWNYADGVSSAPLHYPAAAAAEFHLFGEREPLQSSQSRVNYSNSSQFQVSKKKRLEKAEIEHLMARILKRVHSEELEAEHLVTIDGKPNIQRIKALFKQFDRDESNSLSRSELESLIHTAVRAEDSQQLNHQEMVKKFMEDFDTDGDSIVDEQEFVHGMTKWLNKAMDVTKCKDARTSIHEFNKIMWGEVDSIVYEVGRNEGKKFKILTWGFTKSTLQVILGIAILTFLSGPLNTSIQRFSDAIGVPSFFISFVVVPISLNALSAISAVFPASQKSSRTSSLTFSEIYGGVVMNNIMGLTALLAIVYAKGLEWDYSAEVMTILVVCTVIGFLAFSQTAYPFWTCFLAFFLYPFSLLMYYVFQYVIGWA